ncbi:hypothetical protein E2C01_046277 [Portunus trituberculatus]|uniref:Uncharacterized protein n=1 Tax=Portunus trituberculatus TaxID=210409 RepID=A0A5B7G5J4_PORTR|nr:hypothetical protein [Portunus trituberculatus]
MWMVVAVVVVMVIVEVVVVVVVVMLVVVVTVAQIFIACSVDMTRCSSVKISSSASRNISPVVCY